ncbi:hypothetical protein [Tumebacillus lipolyticus]|uniref:Uncharacterized protein n=1 Tax=Tumebacillus lipolyticus TaxID=1280370 RepID=A0ABW5A063_9BACL
MNVGTFLNLMGYGNRSTNNQGLIKEFVKGVATPQRVAQVLNDGTLADLPLKDMANSLPTDQAGVVTNPLIGVTGLWHKIIQIDAKRYGLLYADTLNSNYLSFVMIRFNNDSTTTLSTKYNIVSSASVGMDMSMCMVSATKLMIVYTLGTTIYHKIYNISDDPNDLSLVSQSTGLLYDATATSSFPNVNNLGDGKILLTFIHGSNLRGMVVTVPDSGSPTLGTPTSATTGLDPYYLIVREHMDGNFFWAYGGYHSGSSTGSLYVGSVIYNPLNDTITFPSAQSQPFTQAQPNRPFGFDYQPIDKKTGILYYYQYSAKVAKVTFDDSGAVSGKTNEHPINNTTSLGVSGDVGYFVACYGNDRMLVTRSGTKLKGWNIRYDPAVSPLPYATSPAVTLAASEDIQQIMPCLPDKFEGNRKKVRLFYLPPPGNTPKHLYVEGFYGKPIGVCLTSNTVTVQGISSNHSTLSAGETYYYDTNGLITTDSRGIQIGVALSDTDIFMKEPII